MQFASYLAVIALGATALTGTALAERNDRDRGVDARYHHGAYAPFHRDGFLDRNGRPQKDDGVSLGSRPRFLVDGMDPGPLKQRLEQCAEGPFYQTQFSIGHRGAALQFPEHTRESYVAAARQGAGILECDATFTRDGELVCRHAQCDLHTTTNILATDLAAKCEVPFTPAQFDPVTGERIAAATARCCTSALTRDEFLSLKGKMDAFDPNARTVAEFLGGTADWRTDLYTSRGTLMTHRESIALFDRLGAGFTPELKEAEGDIGALVEVFNPGGDPNDPQAVELAQQRYAQALIDDYKAMGIRPNRVWAQSFNPDDVRYWIENEPAFGRQAVYLDDRYDGPDRIDPVNGDPADFSPTMEEIAAQGVRIIAPPMWFLLRVTDDGRIVPSSYAHAARAAGLDIIAWTFERSDLRNGSRTGVDAEGKPMATFYYQFDVNPAAQAVTRDSDAYKALDVLAREVGILGIFSDWPATVTYYANCMGLK